MPALHYSPLRPEDEGFMRQALALAWQGQYTTTPNPRVGCVFARQGQIIAQGFHQQAGLGHAEVQAMADAHNRGINLAGSTAYVTLEPCAHHGRTGPCAEALVTTGVERVVAAVLDPNPLVAGKGMAILQAANIQISLGAAHAEALYINRGFFSRMVRGRPWVRLKVAASADGTTALNNGTSQWITSPQARQDGHHLRAQACAVLTGIGTVKADNPQLNVRGIETPRQPLKVVVDSKLELQASAQLLHAGQVLVAHTQSAPPAWHATHPNASNIEFVNVAPVAAGLHDGPVKTDLHKLLKLLGQRGINELHLEAGFGLNGSFLSEGLVDEVVHYIAPLFLGPGQGMFRLPTLETLPTQTQWALHSHTAMGPDLKMVWMNTHSLEQITTL
ncbi:bifunctional diaminohydroxyphosphoribosylaminopyrimidine deaminase/5-amino-6-(5-phosphoribosylamino)uracil reductase RibD [Limnobacter sp.]|uniref:bifunctional diaminohydroxyphosphoribosylaminopyrimidine deaminase/5-amino-6-(5-phosphoribosylamino)uracil reductase RibD n=1 Tax=Limnobacter sp. TaxID=2003368 RepID=UPI0035130FC2